MEETHAEKDTAPEQVAHFVGPVVYRHNKRKFRHCAPPPFSCASAISMISEAIFLMIGL